MTGIAGDAIITRTRELTEAMLERDLVGLNVDTGLCYGFNETAAAIWRHLARPSAFDALLDALSAEFVVSPDECRADVAGLVTRLSDEGLVTISPTP